MVEFMEERIVVAVEIERMDTESGTEAEIKSGSGFDPAAIEMKFREAVPSEEIGAEEGEKLFRGEMVADVGIANSGGDADGSCRGSEQSGFGNAETSFGAKTIGSTIVGACFAAKVRVEENFVADSIIKFDGAGDGVCGARGNALCECLNVWIGGVNELRRGEIKIELHSRSIIP